MSLSPELRAGSVLLGFRVERVLGRGGMGVVYLAEQLALHRLVALKLLVPELALDEAYRDRFLRESRLAASLEHPNIVPVHDAGEADGRLYIAMRYVEGTDLGRLLEQGRLSPEQTIQLLAPVADALDTAHARGLVHRDVKPSNILVDQAGRPYLADFGLTKQATERGIVEQSHFAASLDYVAPEQIEREPVGPQADVYSLGCVLHECLTGEPPYGRATRLATLWAHLNDPPPKATGSQPDLPGQIDRVIAQALAKDPRQRHLTCRDLTEAARHALGITRDTPTRSQLPLMLAVVGLALATAAGATAYLLDRGGGSGVPRSDLLYRIDPGTNRVAERVPAGHGLAGVAVGAGAVWVSSRDDGSVWRIDAETRDVTKVPGFPEPGDIAVGKDSIYVGFRDGVGEINRANLDRAAGTVSLGSSGQRPPVVSGSLGLWAVDEVGSAVVRLALTPRLGATGVVKRIPIARTPDEAHGFDVLSGIGQGDGVIWVTGDAVEPVLFRVDPSTHEVRRFPLPSAPGEVATAAGAVWVAGQIEDVVWRIDPRTGAVTDTIRVAPGVSGLAAAAGGVWVESAIEGTVSRIDPASRRVVATIEIGGRLNGIAAGQNAVWVASGVT